MPATMAIYPGADISGHHRRCLRSKPVVRRIQAADPFSLEAMHIGSALPFDDLWPETAADDLPGREHHMHDRCAMQEAVVGRSMQGPVHHHTVGQERRCDEFADQARKSTRLNSSH